MSTFAANTKPAIRWRRVWEAGLLSAGLSAAVNALLFFSGRAFGAFPATVIIPDNGPLMLAPVIMASVIGAVGATLVFAAFARLMHPPIRVFRGIALVFLLLSFFTPFTIPGAPAAMIISLLLMHVVVAAVSVWLLTTRTLTAAGS